MRTIPIIPEEKMIKSSPQSMDLIIKPTELCNFRCTFCSSTKISDVHSQVLDLDSIFAFLKRYPNTNTIIVNGGDPLMVKPEYYWEIIDFLDAHDMHNTSISFTTNLWAFYRKPKKWVDLFRNDRVGVTTSFHYGDTRLKGDGSVFSEDDFWLVSDTMNDLVGYRPDFISVITDENEETAIDNVLLAREMDVECKLNYAMASGDQGVPYQLSKIYQTYLEVYHLGLTEWEYNTKQMIRRLYMMNSTTCPQNRGCDSHIRALNPGGDYYSCGAFGDDREYPIDFDREIYHSELYTPLQDDLYIQTMTGDCYGCTMFNICNGCRKTVKDMKDHGMAEKHCEHMKELAFDIQRINSEAYRSLHKPDLPM